MKALATIYVAGGCFWGVEAYFARVKGVIKTSVGYANSTLANPSYEDVCANRGDGVEAVAVTYDPTIISYEMLMAKLFQVINPVSLNQQGNDRGRQYRTGIYYQSEAQRAKISAALSALQAKYDRPIAVENLPLTNYYLAEAYHQDYLGKNPNGYCHIDLGLADANPA